VAVITVAAGDGRRGARHRAVRRDIPHDHETVGANPDVVANRNRSQKNRAGTDQHVVADSRVTFPMMLACSAEGDVMEHDTITADYRSFADHHAGPVVAEIPFADPGPRMDFEPGEKACTVYG
jgi:hypothetical protein